MMTVDLIPDIDEHIDIEEALEIKALEKLDKYRILDKLLRFDLRRAISNIKDNATLDRMVYMDTYRDIVKETFAKDLTEGKKSAAAPYIESVDRILANMENNYLDLRMSIKGFRSKQIIESVSSDFEALHNRRSAFQKAFTPSEKSG